MSGQDVMPAPLDISANADDLGMDWANVGKEVARTQIATQSVEVIGWEGDSNDAYADEARTLKEHTLSLVDCFAPLQDALTPWAAAVHTAVAQTIPGYWGEYDQATADYQTDYDNFDIEIQEARAQGHPYSLSVITQQRGIFLETRDSRHSEIVKKYHDTLQSLDDTAGESATAVRAAVDRLFGGQPAPEGRDAIGAALFADMPLTADFAAYQAAYADATEAAGLLEDFAAGDIGALEAFADQYGGRVGDPAFELALAEVLGPEGFNDAMASLAEYRSFGDDPHGGAGGVTPAMQSAFAVLAGSFATMSGGPGQAMGAYTAALQADEQPAWLDSLVETGSHEYTLHSALGDEGESGSWFDGYWAQGQLLAFAHSGLGRTPGAEFFDVVGGGLADSEIDRVVAYPGSNPTAHSSFQMAGGVPFWDPDRYDIPYADDLEHLNDPMAHFISASGGSQDAATTFFNQTVGDASGHGRTMMEYLLENRSASGPQTDNGLIARIVEAQGTDRGPGDSASVTLAHNFLDSYSQVLSDGAYRSIEGYTVSLPHDAFAEARVPASEVISSYIDTLIGASGVNGDLTPMGVDGPLGFSDLAAVEILGPDGEHLGYSLGLSEDMQRRMAAVYRDLALDRPDELVMGEGTGNSDNPPAFQRVVAAATAYDAERLNALMAAHASPEEIQSAVADSSRFLDDYTTELDAAWGHDGHQKDEWRDFLVGAAKAADGKVPVGTVVGTTIGGPVGTGVGFAVDQAWKHTAGQLIDQWADAGWPSEEDLAHQRSSALETYLSTTLSQQAADAVLTNGYWAPGNDPTTWLNGQPSAPSPASPQWFVTEDGGIDWQKVANSDEAADAYERFLREKFAANVVDVDSTIRQELER